MMPFSKICSESGTLRSCRPRSAIVVANVIVGAFCTVLKKKLHERAFAQKLSRACCVRTRLKMRPAKGHSRSVGDAGSRREREHRASRSKNHQSKNQPPSCIAERERSFTTTYTAPATRLKLRHLRADKTKVFLDLGEQLARPCWVLRNP